MAIWGRISKELPYSLVKSNIVHSRLWIDCVGGLLAQQPTPRVGLDLRLGALWRADARDFEVIWSL